MTYRTLMLDGGGVWPLIGGTINLIDHERRHLIGIGALRRSGGDGRIPIPFSEARPMPHKHNADRRHHIPKMTFKVQNWPAYEAGLRGRGSLTLWIEEAALEWWQTTGPNGQRGIRMRPSRPA